MDVIPALDGVPLNAVELQSALANRSAVLTVYSLIGADAGQYFSWIAPYLYYFDTKIKSRPEDSYSRHSEALILVPLGAKEPRIFQRRMSLERASYTHSLADFYPSAN